MKFPDHLKECTHALSFAVKKLLFVSDYAKRQALVLSQLLQEDECNVALTKENYQQYINAIGFDLPTALFEKQLRQFRHRHIIRLLLREYANLSTVAQTIQEWSFCADVIITHTKLYCEHIMTERFGTPLSETGQISQLYVIAMGKLGGNELNFSSDIDLIFAFSFNGYTNGERSVSNQEYFTKVVQQLIQILQQVTQDGFVFRVDLRLRPNGDSGPLVLSFPAMETYYQEQGRDWERYAMVKARLIDADFVGHQWFNHWMVPFVYRRYIDFSIIESMRSMKAMIEREIQLNTLLDDIKRGRGGIREVEFIIQSLQLIRGGRMPEIQQPNAMNALVALKNKGLLIRTVALQKAYLFLRKLENALQTLNDQQTHALPVDAAKQAQVACAMGYHDWCDVLSMLHRYQDIISHTFQRVLNHKNEYKDDKRLLSNQLASLWQGHIEENMAIHLLISLGYENAARCYQMVYAFRHSSRCRRLTQSARLRLDGFMVLLLSALANIKDTDQVLLHVLKLLENIVGRSAYLALLIENPTVLNEILHWFLHSPYITSLIVAYPFLLEVFIDQNESWRPPSRAALNKALLSKLSHAKDVEEQDDVLRQFKLTCELLAARAELYEQYSAVRMSRFLTFVAEIIIQALLSCILVKHGDEFSHVQAQFAIIAYGTLGSYEMNYQSDVDLVFLHTLPIAQESLAVRLTQKILHRLTTRTQFGVLYTVDTRLRPSGSSGLLISHVDAFVDYQRNRAWTWEHQALLRARVLIANRKTRQLFQELKRDILLRPRDIATLADEILTMRAKINKHALSKGVKYEPGGLLDLEFLVQFLILSSQNEHFGMHTNTLKHIEMLSKNILAARQIMRLKKAYRIYQDALHQFILQNQVVDVMNSQKNILHLMDMLYGGHIST